MSGPFACRHGIGGCPNHSRPDRGGSGRCVATEVRAEGCSCYHHQSTHPLPHALQLRAGLVCLRADLRRSNKYGRGIRRIRCRRPNGSVADLVGESRVEGVDAVVLPRPDSLAVSPCTVVVEHRALGELRSCFDSGA